MVCHRPGSANSAYTCSAIFFLGVTKEDMEAGSCSHSDPVLLHVNRVEVDVYVTCRVAQQDCNDMGLKGWCKVDIWRVSPGRFKTKGFWADEAIS